MLRTPAEKEVSTSHVLMLSARDGEPFGGESCVCVYVSSACVYVSSACVNYICVLLIVCHVY